MDNDAVSKTSECDKLVLVPIKFSKPQIERVDRLCDKLSHTRVGAVRFAVLKMLDFFERTGHADPNDFITPKQGKGVGL